MVILLLLITLFTLSSFLIFGVYTAPAFFFILATLFVPPFLFKYRSYPNRSVYAFFILWIVFPKYIRNLPFIGTFDLPGISYFNILQTIAVFHILSLLLFHGYGLQKKIQMPINIRNLTTLFFAVIFTTTVSGIILFFVYRSSLRYITLNGNIIENATAPFFGLAFFLGLCAFIVKYKHIEGLMKIMVISGVLLLLEHFIIMKFGLFSFLKIWAYAADQLRYGSIFFGSFDMAAIFIMLAMFAMIYFGIERKKYYFLALALLMILPLQMTYQRTAYLGVAIGIIFLFLYLHSKKKLSFQIISLLTFLLFLLIFMNFSSTIFSGVNEFILGNVRSESKFTDPKSFYDRLGIWYRATDVFIFSFPLGVGEGMSPFYFNSLVVPKTMNSLVGSQSLAAYQSISYLHQTLAHNIYVQFISEYNILGLIVLILFIRQLYKYFRMNRKSTFTSNRIFYASIYAMIAGLGIQMMFDSSSRLYFMYGMFLFFTFFNATQVDSQNSKTESLVLKT